jgi:FAD/FMN-containing dehydrogenase
MTLATMDPALLDRLGAIVGPKGWTTDPAEIAPHLVERRGLFHGATPMLLQPASTAEVAAVLRACAEARVPVVPQGGNTGLVGGQTPPEDGHAILLSLSRLNRIRAVDADNDTMTVEAGCVLAEAQRVAAEARRLFPLSLAAEGSAQIGGVLSTNAGGTAVLRYGTARELVLGLEVVLADGRVWNGLRRLRKDNTGYDVKQLFLGAEGTLGVITAAVLRLFPRPREVQTAFIALTEIDDVIDLFHLMRHLSGDQVTAFELVPRLGLEFVLRHLPDAADPLPEAAPWYVLVELSSGQPPGSLRPALEDALAEAAGRGLIKDAAIAASESQSRALWSLRESLSEAQAVAGASIKHDIAVPVSEIPAFLRRASAAVRAALPGVRPVPFGHIGDGNIHFNLSQPAGMNPQVFLSQWSRFSRIVHDIVAEFGGSISAEHGLGQLKRDEIRRYKDPIEIELMQRIKRALDPDNLMNPGKLVLP